MGERSYGPSLSVTQEYRKKITLPNIVVSSYNQVYYCNKTETEKVEKFAVIVPKMKLNCHLSRSCD